MEDDFGNLIEALASISPDYKKMLSLSRTAW
jgi:hypothetical protein